ncbi:MAG: fasciclin domain-containing protein [Dysgonamonadaceae bacterium]|jgi:uncharacterized surface protein with fasciclin (FAS1) repeats|nr:fasciclin domain-containing protein [Dysgonamonadaceae bacterium]
MIKYKKNPAVRLFLFAVLANFCFASCEDDYIYDNKGEIPEGLNSSIYEYMEKDGKFTYFIRLINDLGYAEVLSRTGSKTLFPANDAAFERFFKNNEYGVGSYDALSLAQKKNIMNGSMLNMAYLANMLSNVSSSNDNAIMGEGRAIRKRTDNSFLDSISFVVGNSAQFPENSYWNRFSNKGLYLVDDETQRYMTFFTPANMVVRGISREDFAIITNNAVYEDKAYYVNGIKIVNPDIICKNGYIHEVEEVLIPAKNMDQLIRENGETNLFSHLMGKFSAPYFYWDISKQATDFYDGSTPLRPVLPNADSIFVKRYFTDGLAYDPEGNTLSNYGLLYYDPANNAYGGDEDMGVMFVPTDEAMDQFFNGSRGSFLKDAYGTWDNIPTSILALFIKNHQKKSFFSSLPHAWGEMNDEASFAMNVKRADIKKALIAGNGVTYITNTVYPPVDYQCVYASTLISNDTKIMNWSIQDKLMKFYLYLRSMENMYNLIIPVDEAFKNYRDPLSWANNSTAEGREIWDFYYSPEYDMVFANIYNVDESGNKSSLKTTYTYSATHQELIKNRLEDIINMHIIVGDKNKSTGEMNGYIDDGQTKYALTKIGATVKIDGNGLSTTISGGGDIEQAMQPASIIKAFDSDNGKTFFVDKIIHDPIKSVYQVLGEHEEFKAFFDLLTGGGIFSTKQAAGSNIGGLGYVVNSFNNFRYTVFVPTKEALDAVFAGDKSSRDLWTWEEIDAIDPNLPNYAQFRKEKETLLSEFLKYHFADNSAYINGRNYSANYETAARYESQYGGGKFRKITVKCNGDNMEVIGGDNRTANVKKINNLYNLMARDYIVSFVTKGGAQVPNKIESSSRAVIHLIDNVLRYEKDED